MCGIIGQFSKVPISDKSKFRQARDSMIHRGPDDAGEWWSSDNRLGLGQRRLSIVDLSPGGHQPMLGANGQTVIVFNGEIYNHHELRTELKSLGHAFSSSSDTEVLLAAYAQWGEDCLGHLNGMFAFALHDLRKRRIFLARDRAGEKPLFYHLSQQGLAFASELKGLLALGLFEPRLDPLAADCYFAIGSVPGSLCIIRDVQKLQPAQAMVFELDTGAHQVWTYWELPPCAVTGLPDQAYENQVLDELESLLQDAVARQMIADVPVGILLSGGVDSSLMTALATRSNSQVKTFTIRFPGHGAYDETEHARLIAQHFGTSHIELDAGETGVDLLPQLAKQFDEPLIDSSMVPTYLISKLIREHCTVAIGGDGGDELFGGYSHYDHILRMQSKLRSLPAWVRWAVSGTAARLLPVGYRGRNYLRAFGMQPGSINLPIALFDNVSRRKLLRNHKLWGFDAETFREGPEILERDLVQQMTRADFHRYLPDDILVKVDRASMMNSLEVRAPFLDYRVIELAFGKVPSALKTTASQRKILLKKLARRVLPPDFDIQRKQGFSIPLAAWLEKPEYNQFFREVLLDSGSGFFDKSFVATLLAGQTKGRSNSERLFGLVQFELWRREYGVSL